MIAMPTDEYDKQSYIKYVNNAFIKYNRKIEAIIKNIESNSLRESDKVKLKKILAQKLLK